MSEKNKPTERARARYNRAAAAFRSGQPAEALRLLEPLHQTWPEDAGIQFAVGRCLLALGRRQEAQALSDVLQRSGDMRLASLLTREGTPSGDHRARDIRTWPEVAAYFAVAVALTLVVGLVTAPERLLPQTLAFQEGRSIGTVSALPLGSADLAEKVEIGEATGDVRIPAGMHALLRLGPGMVPEAVPPVVADSLYGVELTEATDADLERVAHWGNLRSLTVRDSPAVTDAGLVRLATSAHLTALHLEAVPLTANGLAGYKGDDTLKRLSLAHCRKLTEEALTTVAQIPGLTKLTLTLPQVDDEALSRLTDARRLKALSLYGTQVTDAGVRETLGALRLQNLTLASNPGVGDAALEVLSGMYSLEEVTLKEGPFTDVGLMHLAKTPNLRHIKLDAVRTVTAAGIDYLHAEHPAREVSVKNCPGVAEAYRLAQQRMENESSTRGIRS